MLVLLVVSGVGYYWRGNKSDMPEFTTHKLARGNITEKVTATGIINPISTINVGTQVSGTIKEIYVDYNSEVKKNQMLALIDPDLFEAKVAQQRAALDIAKAQVLLQESTVKYNEKNLQRIRKLHNQKYSADKELDLAEKDYDTSVAQLALNKAQVEQAEASLQSAETELRYTKIISPVDGIVVSKAVEVGQTVAASFQTPTLFNVAEDLTKMQIEASVVEADIAKVKEGQVVEFSVDSFPDEIFYGMVTQVRNEAITTSNVVTYEVIIEIDNRDLLGDAYDHEAYIYLMLNRENDALQAYRKAADLFEQDRNSLKEASTLRAIARIEMKNKNYDVAHDLLEKCRNLYRENGDLLGEASALSAIGCLRYIIRDIANARKALMKSVYLYGKVSHHFAEAESLLYLARVEAYDREQGDFDRARAHYKRSIELFDFLGNEDMKKAVLDEYYNFLNRIMAN